MEKQTNPTGKSALVHHRRKFLQSLQKPRKLPIIIVWIILIGFSSTLKIWKIHNLHLHSKNITLKSWFNECWFNKSRFTKIPRFSDQMPAPLNNFTIVNSIQFSEQKWSDGRSFVKSRLGCTTALKNCNFLKDFYSLFQVHSSWRLWLGDGDQKWFQFWWLRFYPVNIQILQQSCSSHGNYGARLERNKKIFFLLTNFFFKNQNINFFPIYLPSWASIFPSW